MEWSFQKRPEGKTKTLHTPRLERILAKRDEWEDYMKKQGLTVNFITLFLATSLV
jgi:hypothetical protein